jgi:ribosomal protein S6--L-glutamate ligase
MKLAVAAHDRHWHWSDLSRAAAGKYELTRIDLRGLQLRLTEANSLPDIATADARLNEFPLLLLLGIPGGTLEQVVFRMDALAALEHSGVCVLNPPRAIETCVDKYLTLQRLAAAGLPIPQTIVCQTVEQALEAAKQLGDDIVLKPLFGSEGKGLERSSRPEELAATAARWLEQGRVLYLQQFIPHGGWDLRLLVIGERLWAMRRSNSQDWRTNASRGASVSAWTPNQLESEFAFRAAAAVGAAIAGVDLVYDHQGTPYLLEVNSAPGWKFISAATGVDIAAELLAYCTQQVPG